MFDAALLESRKGRRSGERKKSLPVAIGLHATVIAALVGAAVWNTGEPPEPVIPVVFSLPSPPPPPLGNGGHHTIEARRSEPPRPVAVAVPEIREVSPVAPVAISDPGGPAFDDLESDRPPGSRNGAIGGTNESPTAGPGTGSGIAPIRVGGDVVPPALVSRIEPDYPESMRRARTEGVVILEAVITAAGDVDDVRVLKSAGAVLDRAASDAVRRWRYRPATLNGRAVSVYLTVTVTFGLRS